MFADLLATDPVIELAPMAGVTNRAFRRVCREASTQMRNAAGQVDVDHTVYVAEMTTSQALLMRHPETLDLVTFDSDEKTRSAQLYGVDPDIVGAAVKMLVDEDMADHVGIDADHITYLDAGKIASDAGITWVALHGRTAAQYYGGKADWTTIARLVEHIPNTPVLGNGDIWSADDAQRMLDETGARGVVVGRGCLGRPWLFGQIRASFAGEPVPAEPNAGVIVDLMRRHGDLLVEMHGDEFRGCQEMRKHMAWYLKGVVAGSETRGALSLISSLKEFDDLLNTINRDQILNEELAKLPRGRTTPDRRVNLPDGWLNSQCMSLTEVETVREAELAVSGG
jgi:tRNA-dihydrouridine synthase